MSYVMNGGLGAKLVLESGMAERGGTAADAAVQAIQNDSYVPEEDVTETAMTVGGAVLVGTVIITAVLLLRKVAV